MTRWGATPEDWAHFDLILGLGQDLLPVVSNPNATISDKSTIKALGKTPSLYKKDGSVVGIAKWTDKFTTDAEIEKWSKVEDYGICLQTRRVRALDIDVEDIDVALKIEKVIINSLGELPRRMRSNSSKTLFAFILEGELPKRVLPVTGGIIEVLGNGQQFVASGVHTSGARYEWLDGLPVELPVVTLKQLDALCAELREAVGTADWQLATSRRKGSDESAVVAGAHDDILPLLQPLSHRRDGGVNIRCPFEGEHSDPKLDPGSSTTYWPRGTGGFDNGHFRCLHAHCTGRSDVEFISALGIIEAGFDVVGDDELGIELPAVHGGLERPLKTNDEGKALATISNVSMVLSSPSACGQHLRYDEFRDEFVWSLDGTNWKSFKDVDYTRLRIELENTGFLPISAEMMQKAVQYSAMLNRFDTAIEWLNGLQWDGVNRVSGFLHRYMTAEKSAYTTAVSDYMWSAMAGRVLEPGCKADAAPIFVGEQYVGKSHAVESMVPNPKYCVQIRLDEHDDNFSRKLRGKLIAEFAELRGLHTKELEAIKAVISRQYEEWVPKYQEFITLYPRRSIFIGTSNQDEIFSDETGNRRWFPVRVIKGDCEAIKRDRNQLWAEAAVLFKEKGVQVHYELANELAKDVRDSFMMIDAWEDNINQWLHKENAEGVKPVDMEYIKIGDIMHECLNIDLRNKKTFDMMRIGKIMRKFDFEKKQIRENGINCKVWIRKIIP